MNPSWSQKVPPSVCPGASVGLAASTSPGSSQRTGTPSAVCMAIRSRAAAMSASVKQGIRYPCWVNPESVPISSRWLR